MKAPGCRRRQLPVLLLWVNGLMTLGFAGARQHTNLCNESLMLEKLPACGKSFEEMMKKVDSKKWCNLTEFIIQLVDVKPRVEICNYFKGHQNVFIIFNPMHYFLLAEFYMGDAQQQI
ncbi:receptor activity-modifying protein 3 isoform X3 [Gymnogyps californianus]|uniref:receptor activity-modifying protein 3 isoform X3 n=1 Tax=Gymnogyps californianus TaxID=33616 RepID=UPI0021C711E3|nr:receptor activity-modifying protein 3 isoform X3 [Gymnogyps californianus]